MCDVASDEQVEEAVRRALECLGRLDAVFVSAGIDGQDRPALELEPAFFRRVLEVNLLGSFFVVRAAGRAMDGGAIVLNASVNGLRAEPRFADYNASKGGVIMLARTLARDLGCLGFWVTAVCPGYVRTRMTAPYLDDPASAAQLLKEIPSGRFGEPEEVAALVSFLASPEASYMNGSVVTIDGGRTA
jgi:NAD(P)-dependent dehydrogenase (short-subunit alcohol dehydrogenase family)